MKYFLLGFLLLSVVGGCSSIKEAEDSVLPWNRPAPWELKRDLGTSTEFKKEYMPSDFYEK